MFDIKFDASLQIRKIEYPISFERKNCCVHCGAEHQLAFVDIFGNTTNKEIHPFDHIVCQNCGREYSIQWRSDENTGKMFPVAVEKGLVRDFLNLVSSPVIKNEEETPIRLD